MSWTTNWKDAADFVAMGGYGLYVWGAYGVTVLAIGLDAWFAFRRHRDARQELAEEANR